MVAVGLAEDVDAVGVDGIFFYIIRKLRHSVVSRQERMRSILWNWPLGQFFFMHTGVQMKCVSKLTDARRASRGRWFFPARFRSPVLKKQAAMWRPACANEAFWKEKKKYQT